MQEERKDSRDQAQKENNLSDSLKKHYTGPDALDVPISESKQTEVDTEKADMDPVLEPVEYGIVQRPPSGLIKKPATNQLHRRSPFSDSHIGKQLGSDSAKLIIQVERLNEKEVDDSGYNTVINDIHATTNDNDISTNEPGMKQLSKNVLSDSPQSKKKRQKQSIEEKTCSVCGWLGRCRADLGDHMIRHTGQKRFACPKCNKKFKYRTSRIVHERKCTFKWNSKDKSVSSTKAVFTEKNPKTEAISLPNSQENTETEAKSMTNGKNNTETKAKSMTNGHKCKYCEKVWPSLTRLREHLPKHTGERNFSCCKCELRFKYRSACRAHEKICIGSKVVKRASKFANLKKRVKVIKLPSELYSKGCINWASKGCNNVACKFRKFPDDYSNSGNHGNWTCKYCGKQEPTRSKYIEHLVCHTKEKLFSCGICKIEFLHRGTARSHIIAMKCGGSIISNIKSYNLHEIPSKKQKIDDRKTDKETTRKTEQKELKEKRKCVCSVCFKSFLYPSKLKEHQQAHNIKRKISQSTAQGKKLVAKYSTKAILKAKHKKELSLPRGNAHLNISESSMMIRKPAINQTNEIEEEPRSTFSSIKPFSCEWCLMRFEFSNALNNHQTNCSERTLMHESKNAEVVYFSCDQCHKKFKYRKMYQMHMIKSQCKVSKKPSQEIALASTISAVTNSSDKSPTRKDTISLGLQSYIGNTVVKKDITSRRWQTKKN